MATRVLVVDDDPQLRDVLQYTLERQGYVVECVRDGRAAVTRARLGGIDLIVLDVLMPELDGLSACRELRQFWTGPVLFLSSRDEDLDKVLGLEVGGDDYLAKPFSTRELVARVRALLRRAAPPPVTAAVREAGTLWCDEERREAGVGAHILDLTATEWAILHLLLRRPGKVWTRDELASQAYRDGPRHVSDRTLDSHIRNLRAKLRAAGSDTISTVHGLGWRLDPA